MLRDRKGFVHAVEAVLSILLLLFYTSRILQTPLRVYEDKREAKLDELREQIIGILSGLDRRGLLGDLVFSGDFESLDRTLQGVFPEREAYAATVTYMLPMRVTERSGLPRRGEPVEATVDVPRAADPNSIQLRDAEGRLLGPVQAARPWMRTPLTLTWHHLWRANVTLPLTQCSATDERYYDEAARSSNCKDPLFEVPPLDVNNDGFLDYPDRNSLALYMDDWFDPRWSYRISLRSRGKGATKVTDNATITLRLHELMKSLRICSKGVDESSFIVTDRLGVPVDFSISYTRCTCSECTAVVSWRLDRPVDRDTVLDHWLYFNTLDVELPAADCPSFTAGIQRADATTGRCVIADWTASPPDNGAAKLQPRKGSIKVGGGVETAHGQVQLPRDHDFVEVPLLVQRWWDAQTFSESSERIGVSIIRLQPVRLKDGWRFRWLIKASRVGRSVEFRGFVSAANGTCRGYKCVTIAEVGGGDDPALNEKEDSHQENKDVFVAEDNGFYLCSSTKVRSDVDPKYNDPYDLFELTFTIRDEVVDSYDRVWKNTLPNVFITIYKPQTRLGEGWAGCAYEKDLLNTKDHSLLNDDASALISLESGMTLDRAGTLGAVRANATGAPARLLSWNDVPGPANATLLNYLREYWGADWAKAATIRKTENGGVVRVAAKTYWAELRMSGDQRSATLTLSDGRTGGLSVRAEGGELVLYTYTREPVTTLAIAPYPSSYATLLPTIPFIASAGNYFLQRSFYLYAAYNTASLPTQASAAAPVPSTYYTLDVGQAEAAPRITLTWLDDFRPSQTKEYYLSLSVGTQESEQAYGTDLGTRTERRCYDCPGTPCASMKDCQDHVDDDKDNKVDDSVLSGVKGLNNTHLELHLGTCGTDTPSPKCGLERIEHGGMDVTRGLFSAQGDRTAVVEEEGPVRTVVRLIGNASAFSSRERITLYRGAPDVHYALSLAPSRDGPLPSITGAIAVPIYNMTVSDKLGRLSFDVDASDLAANRPWFADWGYGEAAGSLGVCTVTYALLSGNLKSASFSQDRWQKGFSDTSGIDVAVAGTPYTLTSDGGAVTLSADASEKAGEDVHLLLTLPKEMHTAGGSITIRAMRTYTASGGRSSLQVANSPTGARYTVGRRGEGDAATWGDGDISSWTVQTFDLDDLGADKPFRYVFLTIEDSGSTTVGKRTLSVDDLRVEGSRGTDITLVPSASSPKAHESYPFTGVVRVYKEDFRESDDLYRRRAAPFSVEVARTVPLDGGTAFPMHEVTPLTTTASATYALTTNNRRVGFGWVKLFVWSYV